MGRDWLERNLKARGLDLPDDLLPAMRAQSMFRKYYESACEGDRTAQANVVGLIDFFLSTEQDRHYAAYLDLLGKALTEGLVRLAQDGTPSAYLRDTDLTFQNGTAYPTGTLAIKNPALHARLKELDRELWPQSDAAILQTIRRAVHKRDSLGRRVIGTTLAIPAQTENGTRMAKGQKAGSTD